MENLEQKSLSGIALEHHEFIPVLEKYGLDFCCRGNKTLADACIEKNISISNVMKEIKLTTRSEKSILPFTEMNPEQLISYILIHHHFYVRNILPVIFNRLEKLVTKHGERYPYLKNVFQLFSGIKDELKEHMDKEENILFPAIKELATLQVEYKDHRYIPSQIKASIEKMIAEHDHAGQLMFDIRDMTNNYTAPADACTTHIVCLEELKTFEKDLHQHVHLENNILFPMASAIINRSLVEESSCRLESGNSKK